MINLDIFVSFLTQLIIIIGLYFSCFWVLVMLNSKKRSKKLDFFPDVSILIPAYNEEEGLSKTVESCLNLNYKGNVLVYVVNDCSTDNTLNIAKKYLKKGVRIVDLKKNKGKAGALNYALKEINTPYFAVVDADSEIEKNSLKHSVNFFKREDGEKVGAVISKMRPANVDKSMLERIQLIEYMMVGLMRFMSAVLYLLHLTPGVLSVYDTKLVKKLKGFDSNNLTEDFELGVKVRKAGYLVEYCENSKVFTNTPVKMDVFLKQRVRWSRGFIQTHKKHKDIFFNRKHGLFGMYQFPMNVIGPILFFMAVFTVSYHIYKSLYEFIFKLIYTPDLISFFDFDNFLDFILTINFQIDLLIWTSLILYIVFIWGIIKFYGYNFMRKSFIKNLLAILLYLMVYNYLYIYVWIVSLKKEYFNEGYDWGTKKVTHNKT